ncbi:hypothetical protein CEUSTIGMA_g7894.t1 [Chlamydomonas eustigma]|uniref:Hexosyltransferase n=1 Tax=Chlamydomonas eustigma TaxID=1157962 RepID=A0A250XBJ2_9CHLO|nr:hypothetical protein CEUSTIGMA_g7894.t1 [Chlamydomonas eustigma]|eukprot:GAX80455.1 hypothetical protein CEUSTIGMA_g7894.t1 [Chlamydomonas eustigma]
MSYNQICLHLIYITYIVVLNYKSGGCEGLYRDLVRRSYGHQAVPSVKHCGFARQKGPCVALIGIQSHPDFHERRRLLRESWIKYSTPGLHFVFILAQPTSPPILSEATLREEFMAYGDVVYLNISEVNCRVTGLKSHAFFQWASTLGSGRFAFIGKADDDEVVNPYQLRLMLTMHPRKDKAFIGRALPFYFGPYLAKEPKFPFPTKFLGMMYIMSYDLVAVIGGLSYREQLGQVVTRIKSQGLDKVAARVRRSIGEDRVLSAFVELKVASVEWFKTLPCQFHNHPGYLTFTERETKQTLYNYTKRTAVVHKLKTVPSLKLALGELLPHIEGMALDCAEWVEGSEGYEQRPYLAQPSAQCQSWNMPLDTC